MKNEIFKGYEQLQYIIEEIMDIQKDACSGRGFPNWDFINNVLSCKEILGDAKLWFHWGKLLIHRPEDEGTKALEHEELEEWEISENGTITLIGKKQEDD